MSFDSLLESALKECNLSGFQHDAFSPPTKAVVIAVLKLSQLLWDNCANRNLYNSYEHLVDFLHASDVDIVEATLKLLLRLVQRMHRQKSGKALLAPVIQRTAVLGQYFGLKTLSDIMHGALGKSDKPENAMESDEPTEAGKSIRPTLMYQFYRAKSEKTQPDKAPENSSESAPRIPQQSTPSKPPKTPTTPASGSLDAGDVAQPTEGLVVINVPDVYAHGETLAEIVEAVIKKYDIPKEHHFPIFQKARVALSLTDASKRLKLAGIRFLAVSVFASIANEEQMNSELFMYDPDLIANLAAVVAPKSPAPLELQIASWYALEGISRHRSRILEVLTALNASANYGTIIYSVKRVLGIMKDPNSEEVWSTETQEYCDALCNVIVHFTASSTGGNMLINAGLIQSMALSLQILEGSHLKNVAKFVGALDNIINLIDSTLPTSILKIFSKVKAFGANIFGLEISVWDDIPMSAEVISALPNAFGAICLNQPGLDSFMEIRPMKNFLVHLIKEDNLRFLQDKDVPHLIGSAVDELVRHHPSLKDETMEAILHLLDRLLEIGNVIHEDETELRSLQLFEGEGKDPPVKSRGDRKECRITLFIDIAARFLEGFFQNASHCRDFIKANGVEKLTKFYELPSLPFDFSTSSSSFSLSYLFRVLIESNSYLVAPILIKALEAVLDKMQPFITHTDSSTLAEANEVYSTFVQLQCFLRIFSDLFWNHVMSHGRTVGAVTHFFSDFGKDMLHRLGEVHRVCAFESLLLKAATPKAWYDFQPKNPSKSVSHGDPGMSRATSINGLDIEAARDLDVRPADPMDAKPDEASEAKSLEKDSRVKNVSYFKQILTQIPTILAPTFQGIVRGVTSRRIIDNKFRRSCQAAVDAIGKISAEHLIWERVSGHPDKSIRLSFLTLAFGYLAVMSLDDRNNVFLQCAFVASFQKENGLSYLLNLLRVLWVDAWTIFQMESKSSSDTELLAKLQEALEMILGLLTTLISPKFVHSSPIAGFIQGKEKDVNVYKVWDAVEFLLGVRLEIAPILLYLWTSDFLSKCNPSITKLVFSMVQTLLKAEGEASQRQTPPNVVNPIQALFGRAQPAPVAPDAERVRQLMDMGFPQVAAESALVRYFNNVARAAEYLITHPNIVASATFSVPAPVAAPNEASSSSGPSESANQSQTEPQEAGNAASSSAMNVESSSSNAATTTMEIDSQTPAPVANDQDDSQAANESSQTGEETESASEDKKEQRMAALKKTLDEYREKFREDIVERSLAMLEDVDIVLFDVKDLIGLSKLENPFSPILKSLVTLIEPFAPKSEEASTGIPCDNANRISIRMKLTALFISPQNLNAEERKKALAAIDERSRALFVSLLCGEESLRHENDKPSSWLAPLLLIIEVLLEGSDGLSGNFGNDEDQNSDERLFSLSSEAANRMLDSLLKVLALNCEDSLLFSILRFIIRLSRTPSIAVRLVKSDTIKLFLSKRPQKFFSTYFALISIIFRHIVESDEFISIVMRKELHDFLASSRRAELSNMLKGKQHLVNRRHDTFVRAIVDVCKLSKYESGQRQNYIILKEKKEDKPTSSVVKSESGEKEVESEKPKESEFKDVMPGDALSPGVASIIVSEILSLKGLDGNPEAVNEAHYKRCFYLLLLSELVASYPSCKLDAIWTSKKDSKRTPSKQQKTGLLHYLLSELLPCPGDDKIPDMRANESRLAGEVLIGLCLGLLSDEPEKKTGVEGLNSRRATLDAIAKSVKDAVASNESLSIKYSRYFALSDLIYRILTAPSTTSKNGPDESLPAIVKVMLEKNFVAVLTNMLSSVDLYHPQSTELITIILKPIEFLSKAAIRLGRLPDQAADKPVIPLAVVRSLPSNRGIEADLSIDVDRYAEPTEGNEALDAASHEISDIYHNSALGMYNVRDSDQEDEDDDEEMDGEDDEEDEYHDFEEGEMSNEDEEEDDSDPEDDMEIVVPQPYHGALDRADSTDGEQEDDDADDHVEVIDAGAVGDMGWVGEIGEEMNQHEHDEEHDEEDENEDMDENEDEDEDDDDEGGQNDDGDGFSDDDDIGEVLSFGNGDGALEFTVDVDAGDAFIAERGGRRRRNGARRGLLDIGLAANGDVEVQGNEVHNMLAHIIPGFEQINGSRSAGVSRSSIEEAFAHPLLMSRAGVSVRPARQDYPHVSRPGYEQADWQVLEDFLGGQALQVFQNWNQSLRGSVARGDVFGRFTGTGLTHPSGRQTQSNRSGAQDGPEATAIRDELLKDLGSAVRFNTTHRWLEESVILFGNVSNAETFASRVLKKILDKLIPEAEEEQALKEREQEEQAAKAKAEASSEAQKETAEVTNVPNDDESAMVLSPPEVSTQSSDVAMEEAQPLAVSESSQNANCPAEAALPESAVEEARNTVNPEAEQAEQAAQSAEATAEAAQESAAPPEQERVIVVLDGVEVDITGTGIDPEFLAALPDDLRGEVVREHLREQRLREPPPAVQAPVSEDLSDFLAALPPDIRDDVLRQQGPGPAGADVAYQATGPLEIDPASFIAALDPALRQAVLLEQDDAFVAALPPALAAEANPVFSHSLRRFPFSRQFNARPVDAAVTPAQPPKKPLRDVVQLVDKQGLMPLIRVLFIPNNANRGIVHKVLLNLSENSRSKADVVLLLLSILTDGSLDIYGVDRSFAALSLDKKGKSPFKKKMQQASNSFNWLHGTVIPNLVTQRTLETLVFLAGSNEEVITFLVKECESTQAQPVTPKSASKKAKGKEKASTYYPVVQLLGLLEKQPFISNTALLEQLVHLLSTIFRHLSALSKKKAATEEGETKKSAEAPNDTTGTSSANQAPKSDGTGSSKAPESKDEAPFVPPPLPESNLRAVVNVLRIDDCSPKIFQYTLLTLQHMSSFNEYQEKLLRELSSSAQSLATQVIEDIGLLKRELSGEPGKGGSGDQDAFSKYALSSSNQSKLLRVLKAIDFMLSRTASSMDAASNLANAEDLSGKDQLIEVYEKIEFASLWSMLGELLEKISALEEMVNLATTILPLIETFMVVSKPYITPSSPPKDAKGFPQILQRTKSMPENSTSEIFLRFTEEHRKVLNAMVRNNPSLMSGSFSLLVLNARMLDFDNKRTFFTQQLHKRTGREQYGTLQINVRRAHVFEDSYHQLQGRTGDEIRYGKLSVRFHDEEGVDAGGVTREWFSVLARQMFNPDYALFKPSAVDKVTYQPNRSSWINPDHLSYFRFVGRIIGKAIYDGRLLDCYFTRSFYKAILEIAVDWKDMEAIDPEFHKSLEWMLQNDITDVFDLTFSTEVDEFGRSKILDLKPGGRNIAVTEENKVEYVKLITEQKLVTAIRQQIDAFLGGFYDIIPKELVKIFNEQELELLISGMPDIDIDDWKNNTEYQNYTSTSPQIQWFWRAVRSFSQEERAKLIQFATGTSKVPLEGFKALEGSGGIQKFQIHKDFSSTTRLPSAHTCFNQVDLPEYESYEQLRANLLVAIQECGTGFGFA
ncbi:hypothetical protein HDU96_001915 [Phlyctochytrium bullatum]|nr:hypothetical protein HDU96_001915 [Phlyctochytrium bullatum]